MGALMLHRLGKVGEAINGYGEVLEKSKAGNLEILHASQGMYRAMRDGGAVLAAERYVHDLLALCGRNPTNFAAVLVERDNTIDFHEWSIYARKIDLARSLKKFSDKRPDAFAFPATFVLPEERTEFLAYSADRRNAIFIAKPHRGTGGQGISITRNAGDLVDRDDIVVQEYIERPYLVDGRKGHLRIYGLVTNVDPLRAYVYSDGIVRFAPERYDLAGDDLTNVHMHITNTALHRNHPDLKVSDDPSKDNFGNLWSVHAFLERVRADGIDTDALWVEVRSLVRGFLDMVGDDGLFQRQARAAPRRAFGPKLFGLDVLVDADGKPWLIEAQRKPAISGAALVRRVNGQMFRSIIAMSSGNALDDRMSGDQIAKIAKDPAALRMREHGIETARKGQFKLL